MSKINTIDIQEAIISITKIEEEDYICLTDMAKAKKTIKRASADVGLIFTAYNLRRIMNLVDLERLKVWLKALFLLIGLFLKHFRAFWRIQNSYLQLFCAKVAIRISKLMHTFIAEYSPKTAFEEGY